MKTKKKTVAEKKQDAEWNMLLKLQKDHGYFLGTTAMVKKNHNPFVSTFTTTGGKMTHHMKYMVTFSVPLDSALGEAMVEAAKKAKKKPAKKAKK